jgi:SprT protein
MAAPDPPPPFAPTPTQLPLFTLDDGFKPWQPVPRSGQLPCLQSLTDLALNALQQLGIPIVPTFHIAWNPRLRSTAGRALYPAWRIELNPLVATLPGELERTMRHELAHLVAFHRARGRRIPPHGAAWRTACAQLGIPDEPATHRLPLPSRQFDRSFHYTCPHCAETITRARPLRRPSACYSCCHTHNGGHFDRRFLLKLATPHGKENPSGS